MPVFPSIASGLRSGALGYSPCQIQTQFNVFLGDIAKGTAVNPVLIFCDRQILNKYRDSQKTQQLSSLITEPTNPAG